MAYVLTIALVDLIVSGNEFSNMELATKIIGQLAVGELPDELESQLTERTLTADDLSQGNLLSDLHFPKGTLVMMVKREGSFIVPNGQLELQEGDILLTINRIQSETTAKP